MARLVKKEYKGPFEIKVGTQSILICMCGLSNNQHFVMIRIQKQLMKITKLMHMTKKAIESRLRIGKRRIESCHFGIINSRMILSKK
jgi:hypothetical protein